MFLTDSVTVLIFTRNRQDYLLNLLSYLHHINLNVLVLDGSDVPIQLNSTEYSNVKKIDLISLRRRCELASGLLQTKYTCILGDDDFLPYSSIAVGFKILESSDLASIVTTPTEFNSRYLKSKSSHGDYALAYSTEEAEAHQRLKKFLEKPMDRQFYGFFRTNDLSVALKSLSQNFDKFSDDEWMVFYPLLFEALFCLIGKSREVKDYIYLKRCMEDPLPLSKNRRVFVNDIHKEIKGNWLTIFENANKRKLFIDQLLKSMESTSSEIKEEIATKVEELLVFRVECDKFVQQGSSLSQQMVKKFGDIFPSLSFLPRAIYRYFMQKKMMKIEGRLYWHNISEDEDLHIVGRFARRVSEF